MLHARSDAGEDQSGAQARKSARESHHQISRCRNEGRQRQRRARTEPGDQPVARDLQAAHRAIVEGPNYCETGIRQAELRLPDRQQRIEQIRITVVQQMGEARSGETTSLR
jgi:hypothetical protein